MTEGNFQDGHPCRNLRKSREEHGLSLRCLAHLAGVSPSHLCDMEYGRRNPSPAVAGALNKVLGEEAVLLPPTHRDLRARSEAAEDRAATLEEALREVRAEVAKCADLLVAGTRPKEVVLVLREDILDSIDAVLSKPAAFNQKAVKALDDVLDLNWTPGLVRHMWETNPDLMERFRIWGEAVLQANEPHPGQVKQSDRK